MWRALWWVWFEENFFCTDHFCEGCISRLAWTVSCADILILIISLVNFKEGVLIFCIHSSSKDMPSLLSEAASFIRVFLILRAGCRTCPSSCQHSLISFASPDKIWIRNWELEQNDNKRYYVITLSSFHRWGICGLYWSMQTTLCMSSKPGSGMTWNTLQWEEAF